MKTIMLRSCQSSVQVATGRQSSRDRIFAEQSRSRNNAERRIWCHETLHARGRKRNELQTIHLAPPIGCAPCCPKNSNSPFPGSKIVTGTTVSLLKTLVNVYAISRRRHEASEVFTDNESSGSLRYALFDATSPIRSGGGTSISCAQRSMAAQSVAA